MILEEVIVNYDSVGVLVVFFIYFIFYLGCVFRSLRLECFDSKGRGVEVEVF